jgi:dTDP-4-amino-4,6-dideoxygalactose transaminase
MTELEAAIGLAELDDWEKMIKKRQDNAVYLMKGLGEIWKFNATNFPVTYADKHSFMFFPMLVDRRDELMIHLERKGIQTRTMMPLINQPLVKPYVKGKKLPAAEFIGNHGLLIGCHQYLKKKDLDYIIDNMEKFYA